MSFAGTRYVLGLLALGTGLVVAYAGLIVGALSCDERCSGDPGDWTTQPDAWQWDAVQGISGGLALVACLLLAAVIARRERAALAILAVQVALTATLVGFAAAGNNLVETVLPWAGVLAFVPCALGAAALGVLRADARRPSGP
jgi:hypothetical protein